MKAKWTFGIVAAFLVAAIAVFVLPHPAAIAAPLEAGDVLHHAVSHAWMAALLGARPANLTGMRAAVIDARKKAKAKNDRYNVLAAKAERSDVEETEMAALDAELTSYEEAIESGNAAIAEEERRARRASAFSAPSPADAAPAPRNRAAMEIRSDEPDPARTGGFRSMAEFAVAVRNHFAGVVTDERLAAPANVHENGGASGEGLLVPVQFRQEIWTHVFEGEDLLNYVTLDPTSGNAASMLKDETTPWGASGVTAAWRNEGAQMSASKASVKQVNVQLHPLYAFVNATDELLADAPRLRNHLTVKAAQAIRWKASDAIAWGDGVAKPDGFMTAAALVSVAKESGQAADTIVAANVAKMLSRGIVSANTFWMVNQDTLPQIMVMTIGNQPIWTPPNAGFKDAPGGFLLGRPVRFMEHAATVGDLGDIVLVNPDGYFGLQKEGGGIDFASSIHLYFDYGVEAFRWTFRIGGRPLLSAAMSPARGSSTRSHFVALAARA